MLSLKYTNKDFGCGISLKINILLHLIWIFSLKFSIRFLRCQKLCLQFFGKAYSIYFTHKTALKLSNALVYVYSFSQKYRANIFRDYSKSFCSTTNWVMCFCHKFHLEIKGETFHQITKYRRKKIHKTLSNSDWMPIMNIDDEEICFSSWLRHACAILDASNLKFIWG